jgi:NADPH2:quinone reductase
MTVSATTIPAQMRAIRLDAVGEPENLQLVTVDTPAVPDDGILIETAYSGMIYADAEARRGTYYAQTRLPWFPGREVAGTVVAVGTAVTKAKVGDRVAAIVMAGGCYAEYALARTVPYTLADGRSYPPSDIVALPDTVGFDAALVYVVNFRLAHLLVYAWAKVQPGATAIVHGATGGMGTMILDILRAMDATAIALVRTEEEAAFCTSIGADHAIDITAVDYVDAVKQLTSGEGVDFSFNGVGGDTLNRDPLVLAPFGEIHAYGYVAGKQPFDVFAIDGTISLRTFSADSFFRTPHFPVATEAMVARFAEGDLIAPGAVYALADAPAAHRAIESGRVLGKILLKP